MKSLLLSALITLFFIPIIISSQDCADSANIYSFMYDGRAYEIVKENKNWLDAAACAVERGGILAEIDSQDEQDSIYFNLQLAGINASNTVAPDGGGASYVWLGGNDGETEGKWVWDGDNDGEGTQFWEGTTSGNPVNDLYNNWGNEPDNFNNQDGLGLSITDWPFGVAGQWNDVDHNNLLYFIIEYEYLIGKSTIYVPDDRATISDAISVASQGDTIIVRDGIYDEKILIDKSLTLLSENPLGAQIGDSLGIGGGIIIGTKDGISDVLVEGFKIVGQSNGTGILVGDFVNELFVTNCNIKNNLIANLEFGISINSTATNTTIENNTIHNIIKRGLAHSGGGTNTISNNHFHNNGYQGIMVFQWASGELLISDNIVEYNQRNGIEISADSVIIKNNTIEYNGLSGIFVAENSEAVMDSNMVAENNQSGIMVYGAAILHGNTISKNINNGIYVTSSIIAEDNIIDKNTGNGIETENSAQNLIFKRNQIISNGFHGVLLRAAAILEMNNIEGNGVHGIFNTDSAVDVMIKKYNIISNNTECGIFVEPNGSANIDSNAIEYNTIGIKVLSDAGTVTLRNNYVNNNEIGIESESAINVRNCLVENNTNIGISIYHSEIDLGQDSDEEAGMNIIRENGNWNLDNNTNGVVSAYLNYWSYTNSGDIDATIFDDNEDNTRGAVNFEPFLTNDPTSIEQLDSDIKLPKEYVLSQNYPNPFNPVTTIKYSIPTDLRYEYQDVRLIVYDILGREVAILVDENKKPGNYEVDFDASQLTSGIYFYQLNTEDYTETKKMILLK